MGIPEHLVEPDPEVPGAELELRALEIDRWRTAEAPRHDFVFHGRRVRVERLELGLLGETDLLTKQQQSDEPKDEHAYTRVRLFADVQRLRFDVGVATRDPGIVATSNDDLVELLVGAQLVVPVHGSW